MVKQMTVNPYRTPIFQKLIDGLKVKSRKVVEFMIKEPHLRSAKEMATVLPFFKNINTFK